MASSYAALVSLVHVLNRIQHPGCPASFEHLPIQSLSEKVNSLIDFHEAYSKKISEDFAAKMVVVAFEAEDKIESYIRDRILIGYSFLAECKLNSYLVKAIQQTDIIIQEAMEVKANNNSDEDQLAKGYVSIDSSVNHTEMIKMVGFDDELIHLIRQLTARQCSRKIIPIVGMGGIGKSTLARNVYNHPPLKNYFDVKAWVTVSQDFNVGKSIRPLLSDIGVLNVDQIEDKYLGEELHKTLYGRKYLIILDDIWDSKAWDEISRFCPDNNNGSRIVLTTRILNVAHTVGSCSPFDIQLLDDDKSWVLLSQKVFGVEACPPELEECGKKISKSCKGLPLAIAVIGGLLKTSEKTQEYWEEVAENIDSTSREDGDQCLKILSSSYYQLPIQLKPCFLYLATFPYGREISVSQLIRLWVADGFLRPNVGDITLEEVALKYVHDLVNRNLITVNKLTSRGRMKVLTVHDLVMDLCFIEVKREMFLYVDNGDEEFAESRNERRIVYYEYESTNEQPKGFPRSFASFAYRTNYPAYISRLSLLRVISVAGEHNTDELMHVNLRLLHITVEISNYFRLRNDQFSELSLLWNLETLIVNNGPQFTTHFDSKIWNLRHIKHLKFGGYVVFPDPPILDADYVFQNLQTLEIVENISNNVIDMIPNIKKLGIAYVPDEDDEELSHSYDKLAQCRKLETLKLSGAKLDDMKNIKFPDSLRKLVLTGCKIPRRMCSFGSLPNLEVLITSCSDFEYSEWNTVEGEFPSLKILLVVWGNLKKWTMEDCCHFPSLERLSLNGLQRLKGIPEVFGESTTLESIKLINCSRSAYISAKEILDQQQSEGSNYDLTVKVVHDVRFLMDDKEMRADLEGMASDTDNFHVTLRD